MDCSHVFVTTGDCNTCVICGVLSQTPFECSFQNSSYLQSHSPFYTGYCRKKRFKNLTQCLLFPSPSRTDDNMVQFFVDNKLAPTVCGIENALRSSCFKDKRFSCIHLYAKLFSPDYKTIETRYIFENQKRLLFFFELFESKYVREFPTGFINYNFILSFLLKGLKLFNYLPFIKKTKCKRRRKFYISQLVKLDFTFHIDP